MEPVHGDELDEWGHEDEDADDDEDDEDDDAFEAADGDAIQALGLLLSGSTAQIDADVRIGGGGLHALLQQLSAMEMRAPGSIQGLQLPPAPTTAAGAAAAAAAAAAGGGASAEGPRIVDALTGMPVPTSTPVVRIQGSVYDAVLMADYLACTRDLRDPLSGERLSPDDVNAVATAVEAGHRAAAERLRSVTQRDDLPASPLTTRATYFQDMAHALALQLLAICELEAMDSITVVQATYVSLWPAFVRAMCGLASADVLRAATAAVAIREMTSHAYAEAIREDATLFVHEPAALQPVASSIFALCSAAVSGALFAANLPQVVGRMAATPPLPMMH